MKTLAKIAGIVGILLMLAPAAIFAGGKQEAPKAGALIKVGIVSPVPHDIGYLFDRFVKLMEDKRA